MPQTVAIDDAKAQKALEKIMKRIETAKDGGREFGMLLSAVVFQDIIDHFEKEEFLPFPTAPWSASYRRQMAARGKEGNKLLQDSGRLKQSFQPTNFRRVSEGITWFNPAKTDKGFPYAAHHNETAKTPRTFMWLSDAASEKIAGVTLNYVIGK